MAGTALRFGADYAKLERLVEEASSLIEGEHPEVHADRLRAILREALPVIADIMEGEHAGAISSKAAWN